MKTLFALISLALIYGCVPSPDDEKKDETTIERQEDIRRDDIIEKRNMETPDQLELDRDVLDLNELNLDE